MSQGDLLFIVGGTVLPMDAENSVLRNATVVVSGDRIEAIWREGQGGAIPSHARVLDASGGLVLPGFVNGHTHAGMTLLRGVGDDLELFEWLESRIFPLEKQFVSETFVYLSTRLAALEMIRGGVTTANDMYMRELDCARAFQDSGMRAVTALDIKGEGSDDDMVDSIEEFLEGIGDYTRCTPALGPHAVYSIPEERWLRIAQLAREKDVRIHVHLAETAREVRECREHYDATPAEAFERWGLWEQKCIAAHGVHLNDRDIAILAKHGVGVSHNPESNLKLASGIAPVTELRSAGIAVAIGTDGAASNNDLDLLAEASVAAKLQSFIAGPGLLPARDVVRMLTIEGAKALHMDAKIGSLEVGKQADIVVLDVCGAHAVPLYDPYSHLVYSAKSSDVRHTVVDGNVLMEERKIVAFDEAALLKDVHVVASQVREVAETSL